MDDIDNINAKVLQAQLIAQRKAIQLADPHWTSSLAPGQILKRGMRGTVWLVISVAKDGAGAVTHVALQSLEVEDAKLVAMTVRGLLERYFILTNLRSIVSADDSKCGLLFDALKQSDKLDFIWELET